MDEMCSLYLMFYSNDENAAISTCTNKENKVVTKKAFDGAKRPLMERLMVHTDSIPMPKEWFWFKHMV